MKKIMIIVLACLLLSQVYAADLQYTELYETDDSWCKDLYIVVSGVNISSDEYFLVECGESETSNTWYCNCDPDDDFSIVFANSKQDLKTYVVDIISGSNNVRRVVAKNDLKTTEDMQPTKSALDLVDDRLAALEERYAKNSKEIRELQDQDPIIYNSEGVEAYNDTLLIAHMRNLSSRVEDLEYNQYYVRDQGLGLLYFDLAIIVAGVGILFMMWLRDNKKQ